MPEGNPLVAQAQDTTTGVTGIGIAESAQGLAHGVSNGDWVEAGLSAAGVGLEVLSMVIDPLGTLASYGVSWLIEHVRPLKEALDWFAGDPPVIQSFSQTWANVAKEVNSVAQDYLREAGAGTGGWTGRAGDAYRGHAAEAADAVTGAAALADGISAGVMIMGEVVAFVREFIRDLVGELVGRLISWALEAVATLGLATPVIVAQATSAISKVVAKVTDVVRKLVKTIGNVAPRIRKIIDKLDEIIAKLAKLMRRGDGPNAPSPHSSPGRRDVTDGTSPSGTKDPSGSTGSRDPATPDSGTTTPSAADDQRLFSRAAQPDTPWPPERRSPGLDYWPDNARARAGWLMDTNDNVRRVSERYGIPLHPNARVNINRGLRNVYGETVPRRGGARIDIAPRAFVNEEQLARALFHENFHVEQLSRNGWRYPSTQAEHRAWEEAAHAADQEWWNNHPLNQGR